MSLWLVAAAWPAAAADDPQRTRGLEELVRRADFDAADVLARNLLRSGSLSRQDVARVYLQLGIIASAKRDRPGAEAAFRRALRLAGDLRLSATVGPHVSEILARAKASLAASEPHDPEVVLTVSRATGETSIEVGPVSGEDAGLARQIAVRIGEVRETRELGGRALRFAIPLPASVAACAGATASVLDEFGNELWPAIASTEVCRPAPAPARPAQGAAPAVALPATTARAAAVTSGDRTASSRPVSRLVLLTAAAAAAAAVGTAVLGFVALERRDEYDASLGNGATFDQQQRLRELALTAQHRATAGGIITGLLAATGMVLYVRGRF